MINKKHWAVESFPLRLHSAVDITEHEHQTMEVTSSDRCCTQDVLTVLIRAELKVTPRVYSSTSVCINGFCEGKYKEFLFGFNHVYNV